jgi:hypothetical protein
MGLSIHYSGKFNPKASLTEMINEIKDICEVYQWKYKIYETEFPKTGFTKLYNNNIYGISFTPPKCEAIPIEFLSNGRMSSSNYLKIFGFSDNKDYQKYLYGTSVKTQFAGMEVHAVVIHLLRYLSKKYFINFKVDDEGHYWETRDMEVLKSNFKTYEKLLDHFCIGIQTFPVQAGETIENYFKRLIKKINLNTEKGEG